MSAWWGRRSPKVLTIQRSRQTSRQVLLYHSRSAVDVGGGAEYFCVTVEERQLRLTPPRWYPFDILDQFFGPRVFVEAASDRG